MEARYKGKGTRYYPDTIAMMREGAEGSSVLFGLLYDDGDKEEGALGINLRRVGETKLVVAAPVTPVAVTSVAVTAVAVAVIPVVMEAVSISAAAATSTTDGSQSDSRPGVNRSCWCRWQRDRRVDRSRCTSTSSRSRSCSCLCAHGC